MTLVSRRLKTVESITHVLELIFHREVALADIAQMMLAAGLVMIVKLVISSELYIAPVAFPMVVRYLLVLLVFVFGVEMAAASWSSQGFDTHTSHRWYQLCLLECT